MAKSSIKDGNITGISLNEYVSLPTKSKVMVIFDGEIGSDGFLCLKMLWFNHLFMFLQYNINYNIQTTWSLSLCNSCNNGYMSLPSF